MLSYSDNEAARAVSFLLALDLMRCFWRSSGWVGTNLGTRLNSEIVTLYRGACCPREERRVGWWAVQVEAHSAASEPRAEILSEAKEPISARDMVGGAGLEPAASSL